VVIEGVRPMLEYMCCQSFLISTLVVFGLAFGIYILFIEIIGSHRKPPTDDRNHNKQVGHYDNCFKKTSHYYAHEFISMWCK
jgi:hypothetical protein